MDYKQIIVERLRKTIKEMQESNAKYNLAIELNNASIAELEKQIEEVGENATPQF